MFHYMFKTESVALAGFQSPVGSSSGSYLSLHSVMAWGKGSKSTAATAGPETDTSVAVVAVVAVAVGPGAAAAPVASSDGCLVNMSGCRDWYLAPPPPPPSAGAAAARWWCSLGRCVCDRWYHGEGGGGGGGWGGWRGWGWG